MNLWELTVAMVYQTPKGMRERSGKCLCTASDLIDAIHSAKRFGEWRRQNWFYDKGESGAFVGCIKVYPLSIGPVSERGEPSEVHGWTSFEWKYDWPGTLDEHIAMKKRDLEKQTWPVILP